MQIDYKPLTKKPKKIGGVVHKYLGLSDNDLYTVYRIPYTKNRGVMC